MHSGGNNGNGGNTSRSRIAPSEMERLNTLGIRQSELEEISRKLDASTKDAKPDPKREYSRWPFRQTAIGVDMIHPGGSKVSLTMACRNLSSGGVSLLHSCYVHPGTTCTVRLPRLSGGLKEVPGEVKRCIHRGGKLHEIGVSFEEQIDLREFIASPASQELLSLESVPLEKLSGRVLHADDCEIDTRIVQHYLRGSGISVTPVASGQAAVEALRETYDLLIVDAQLPDMTGIELMQKLRASGCAAPCILTSADGDGMRASGVREQLNVMVLTKPMTQDQLVRSVGELLSRKGAKSDGGRNPLSSMFVAGLGDVAAKLEQAAAADDASKVLEVCSQVRVSAAAMGFAQLSAVAGRIADQLPSGQPLGSNAKLVRDLATVCRRIATGAMAA